LSVKYWGGVPSCLKLLFSFRLACRCNFPAGLPSGVPDQCHSEPMRGRAYSFGFSDICGLWHFDCARDCDHGTLTLTGDAMRCRHTRANCRQAGPSVRNYMINFFSPPPPFLLQSPTTLLSGIPSRPPIVEFSFATNHPHTIQASHPTSWSTPSESSHTQS